jgi:hypothetical protein
MKAVIAAPKAPKQNITAMAWLQKAKIKENIRDAQRWSTDGKVNVKTSWARTPIGIVVNTVLTDLYHNQHKNPGHDIEPRLTTTSIG